MRKQTYLGGLLVAFLIAGCGQPTTEPAAPPAEPTVAEMPTVEMPTEAPTESAAMPGEGSITLPPVDAAAATGPIVTAGSSTVYPLTEAIAALFTDEGYAGQVTIDSIGSGAGFERFCKAGETDIANASRAIKAEETELCRAIGREPIEFRVGTDALAVVLSQANTFVDNLTLADLAMIYSGEAKTWADVNPAWPADSIQLFSPGTDSGTFDYFVEMVFDTDDTKIVAANPQMSEDDNVLAQGVMGSPNAIGYFGYAYFQENADTLRAVPIEGVAPSLESAEDNSYPISRPLFIYSTASIMQEKPQVADFISFYLSNVNNVIEEVGYFPASGEALDAAKQAFLDAVGQ
jgi:phosphate transport system substrate-binding protein